MLGKTLVLAEKPSVGRELARVLGCIQRNDGYISGRQYIVTWSLGHLVTLADPEHYGEQYKKWSIDTLPMMPDKMDLVVIKETEKQFKVVKKLLSDPDVDDIVIATDAGREGELVARWIIQKARCHKPMKRLWISSQVDKSIKEGFEKLKPSSEYDNLYRSAQCRAEADWLVGLNVTRALTCKHNAQLSAGRVQTPTLSMIVNREEEIKNFVPKEYSSVNVDFGTFKATWRDAKTSQTKIFDKVRVEKIAKKVNGKYGQVSDIQSEAKKENPPLLYDLTELQRDANVKYGFTAKQTLNLMQKLYEEHKLLTYPRTDSRYLGSDVVPSLKDRLETIAVGENGKFVHEILKVGIKVSKRFVDDSKVSDHHAIIPTEQPLKLSNLTFDEKRIYDLVVKRFLAVMMEPFEYDRITVNVDIESENFFAKGRVVKSEGWKRVYRNEEQLDDDSQEVKDQMLPSVKKGQDLKVLSAKVVNGKTKPPARYTEATLLSAMEHPGKFIDDDELRSVVDTRGGIGTPATRADIIEKLFSTGYAERRGKEIFPLSKGMQLVNLVPEELKSPELTAKWEQRLSAISKGEEKSTTFMSEMKDFTKRLITDVVVSEGNYRHDNMTRMRCPMCDKYLLEVNGKKGKMLVCQDRECGYRQSLSYYSNARCPQCHKKLEVVGEGDKRIYVCKCGFREKFDRFNRELQERKNFTGKRDVDAYMKKQDHSEPQESAFALAWAKVQKEREK